MRSARLVPAIALGAGIAVLVSPATAATKKPITKSWTVSNITPGAGVAQQPLEAITCGGPEVPNSTQITKFKAPAAGLLKFDISGFVGDWDAAIRDSKGKVVAVSDNAAATPFNDPANPKPNTGDIVEKTTYKVKKAGDLQLVICNFAGSPNGKAKYVFTYGK
jgi:hypothetical protein